MGFKGFVGSALALILAHKGMPLVAILRGNDPRREYEIVENLFVSLAIGVVIHLAARVHVSQEAHTDPLAAFWLAHVMSCCAWLHKPPSVCGALFI